MPVRPTPSTRLTPAQAGQILGWSETTLATKRSRGGGPSYIKVNGKVFYNRADVEAFALTRTVEHPQGGAQ